MRTANTSSASSGLRRLGAPIAPIVDVWCVDAFEVLLLSVCQALSRLAYCVPQFPTTCFSSSERVGPGVGVGFGDAEALGDGEVVLVGVGVAFDVREDWVVPLVPPASPSPVLEFFSLSLACASACFLQAEAWTPSSSIFFWAVFRPPSAMVPSTDFCWYGGRYLSSISGRSLDTFESETHARSWLMPRYIATR